MTLQGIIFDMDGVIVDSEALIAKAAIKMFKEKGIDVKEKDFLEFVGTGENHYLGGVAKKYKLEIDITVAKDRTYFLYGQIIKGELQALKGVIQFIKNVKGKGIKIALATSADKVKADYNLNEIGLAENTFDTIVTGSDVENKKPAPDIFLKAAKQLNLEPANCLVIEDAIMGVKAAHSAGCKALGITSSFTRKELSIAEWVADNLDEIPEDLLALL